MPEKIKKQTQRFAKKIIRRIKKIFYKESFGLFQLDIKLLPYLKNVRNGFFIEAGANNGLTVSNTLYFEKYLGWTGLLIEPIPELYEQCEKNRPGCITVNAALVSKDYKDKTILMRYSNLMSLVSSAMKSPEKEQQHIETGCKIQNISTYSLHVPVQTLTAILKKNKIKKVDFLCLDVEGYELSALQGLDFDYCRPTYILVEARFKDEIINFLTLNSYQAVDHFNDYDILFKSTK
jgi:FkbM family methyltransferase